MTGVQTCALPISIKDGAVNRQQLRHMMTNDPDLLNRVQAIVHPLVAKDRAAFLQACSADIAILDIPLLYETGADAGCDAVVVVTAPLEVQRARVMARRDMTEAEFEMILSRQMPDAEKRARADYVVETKSVDAARHDVQAICADIRGKLDNA